MATITVLAVDTNGRSFKLRLWLECLRGCLRRFVRDGISLIEHTSGSLQAPTTPTEPAADAREDVQWRYRADRLAYTQWTERDAPVSTGAAPAEALHTFMLDSGASCCFFRDCTTITPLTTPVPVTLADPSGGPVVARASTVLLCSIAPSGSLAGLHLPSFTTNLVSNAVLQDQLVTTTTPRGELVAVCTDSRTDAHLATFTRRPGSGLYTLTTESAQVAASGQLAARDSYSRTRLSFGTTILVTPPCRVCVACTPVSLSLPPLTRSPALLCLPCIEGRQCAAPHSSSFPPTTAPLQTLHMDADVRSVLIPWNCAVYRQLSAWFQQDLQDLRLHSNQGGEFSSHLLEDFCREKGISQSFTLPASPQQNGIAERRISLIMEAARTSMIHAAAPNFIWPFAVRYAAHQLNLWPRVSVPETSPTLHWRGEVGDASTLQVWGSLALVRDTTAGKLSSRTDVTFDESVGFYRLHPHRISPVPPPPLFLVPGPPLVDPLPPQGLAPSSVFQVDSSPLVEHLEVSYDTSGPAEGVDPAAVDTAATRRSPRLETPPGFPPRPSSPPLQPIAMDSGAAGGGDTGRADSGGAESGGADSRGAESGGAGSRGAESPSGGGVVGAPTGGPGSGQQWHSRRQETLSPQQLCEWVLWRGRSGDRVGATGARGARGAGAGGFGAGGTGARGAGGTGTGGAGARGTGAGGAGATGAGGIGAGGTGGAGAGAGGAGAGGTSAGGAGDGGTGAGGAGVVAATTCLGTSQVLSLPSSMSLTPLLCPPPDSSQTLLPPGFPLPTPSPYTEVTESLTKSREPASHPVMPVRTRRAPRARPPPVPGTHTMSLRPSSVPQRIVLRSPPASSLPDVPDLESDLALAASPTGTRVLATLVTDPSFESIAASALVTELVDCATTCHLDYFASLITESLSDCPPSVGGELALGSDVLEDRQFELECLAATVPHLASMLFCAKGDPDALDIPNPRSYAEAILGEYSSRWHTAMDVEMASWKSTGTYVDTVPPPGVSIVDGMWIFRVKRPPGSLPAFKARYMTTLWVLLLVAAQRDYELHSLEFSTTFLQGSLHEEIWLRRPPGFTGSFHEGTQWSLPRLVYGLRQMPRELHDTLRTSLVALGFAPSTTDPLLFLRTDPSLPPFYILVYVLQRFSFQFSLAQSTPLPTGHSLIAPPLDESIEPNGQYPELVGCLMYLMTCTRPDLAYPLSILARYVAPGRHQTEHWRAVRRVLRYLCSTSGMGLVLGGRGLVVLMGHSDASWADNQATQRSSQGYTFSLGIGSVSWRSTRSSYVISSSCEAEIYAGAMAA
ncbi:unnamed protein product [Closterium sp. NIES-53]